MKTRSFLFLFLLSAMCSISVVAAQPTLSFTVATNKETYDHNDCVTVAGVLKQNLLPLADGLIGLQIDAPKGNVLLTRTMTTGTGTSVPNLPIQITSAYSSGSSNNPQKTLEAGYLGYFTIKISNTDTELHDMVITVTLFDNSNVLLGHVSIPASLMGDQTGTVTVSLPVPLWATAGDAYGYANVYTALPSNHGLPIALEYSFQFTIVNGASGIYDTVNNDPELGFYSFTFVLPKTPIDGVYTVSACTLYGEVEHFKSAFFTVSLLSDFNGDKVPDSSDVLVFVQSYKDYTSGNHNYNPSCDLNHDGRVDYLDVLIFTQSYAKYWSVEK
jgi:hypothetical protein